MILSYEMMQATPMLAIESVFKDLPDGLLLEFGVGEGNSIRKLAALTPRIIHGFDSFEGLPEDWSDKMPKGSFACPVPDVPDNVRLHVGLFWDSFPKFFGPTFDHGGGVAFVHIDCDIYSSTDLVLRTMVRRFNKGAIIAFDEINEPPHSDEHEFKAFAEYLERTRQPWRCIGRQHVCGAVFRLGR